MTARIIDRGRGPEIEGTRITVYDIWDYARENWHRNAIAATLRLSSAQVAAASEYIEQHKQEVLADYNQIVQRQSRGNPPEVQARLDAVHKKWEARLAALAWQEPKVDPPSRPRPTFGRRPPNHRSLGKLPRSTSGVNRRVWPRAIFTDPDSFQASRSFG